MRPLLILLILSITLTLSIQPVHSAPSGWEPVATGIEYQQFHLTDLDLGPNNVFVARMDRSNLNVTLETTIAKGRLASGIETVKDMAIRYDQAINYWGQSWGSRNNSVVAINGYFFDPETGVPWRGQVHSGWYVKRFDDNENGSGFAWALDRTAFIGGCVFHEPDRQFITYQKLESTQKFHGINVPRGNDELILYTPQYDSNTNTDASGLEILVEMTRPTLILPEPAKATGYIREIRDKQGSTPIPFDHIVLSASGVVRQTMLGKIEVGDEVGVSQEITNKGTDCKTPNKIDDWTKTYASLGGSSFYFLKDGVIQYFDSGAANVRDPRTAIAFNDDYIFFIVVDGRNPGVSEGMTIDELARFTENNLQATYGIAQDGGGSSTMVVNGEVVNDTHCNFTDCSQKNKTESSRSSTLVEPLVANGIMMIVVEPLIQSTAFAPDDLVTTTMSTDVRLGPGTNYPILTTIPTNTVGLVLPHLNNLNGVLAKGTYWWKVMFGSTTGWISEHSLPPQDLPYSNHLPLVIVRGNVKLGARLNHVYQDRNFPP